MLTNAYFEVMLTKRLLWSDAYKCLLWSDAHKCLLQSDAR